MESKGVKMGSKRDLNGVRILGENGLDLDWKKSSKRVEDRKNDGLF